MDKKTYNLMEQYMLNCMNDSAHDKDHIYRVLYNALDIAAYEKNVDHDVLITSCLLHDICRKDQIEDPSLCHAEEGSKKAYRFLIDNGFSEDFADKVRHCIKTHRFRKNDPPKSIEAKILFDADKLDVTGAIGIARTLIYKGTISDPLYTLNVDGTVSDGKNDKHPSFFQEYRFKLENIYSRFFTTRGYFLAKKRQKNAQAFYDSILSEVKSTYDNKDKLQIN